MTSAAISPQIRPSFSSQKEKDVYEFYRITILDTGICPSMQEAADVMGVNKSRIHGILEKLEERDPPLVRRQPGRNRSVIILGDDAQAHPIPPRGNVPAAASAMPDLFFGYLNHRGQQMIRHVRPLELRWGTSEYYPEPQWLLKAYCYSRCAIREFSVKNMISDDSIAVIGKNFQIVKDKKVKK